MSFKYTASLSNLLAMLALAIMPAAPARGQPDVRTAVSAQSDAMKLLAAMNGVWRGQAWTLLPSGERRILTQTERIGPMLQGALKVVEGRGYDDQGVLVFNALGIISFDAAASTYNLRSYSQGRAGDFALKLSDDGYSWEIPAGAATIRYTATIKDGVLREIGERLTLGREPLRIFEMTLTKVADSDWPSGGAVGPK